VWTN